ncbi:hypothetical protein CFAM422_007511 [Trichoderma lentiforme]|uniref:Uncharacterized protein n=1 Tax=Trichoderma lentiforme TaxID=1567552 RepID=A0A9P5CAR6_9HYPO|nr:hypothetical protein CFAM422_007511 [Trichoderma lentiforme]
MSACGFNQEMTCVCCTGARGPCTDGLPLSASTGHVPPMAAPRSHDWCLCSLFAGLSGPGRCTRAGLALPMHENEPAQAAMAYKNQQRTTAAASKAGYCTSTDADRGCSAAFAGTDYSNSLEYNCCESFVRPREDATGPLSVGGAWQYFQLWQKPPGPGSIQAWAGTTRIVDLACMRECAGTARTENKECVWWPQESRYGLMLMAAPKLSWIE